MSTKHNTKHLSRGNSNYSKKVKQTGTSPLSDPILSDGRRASAKR